MTFSEFYKGPRSPLARLRQHNPQLPSELSTVTPDWRADEHADLLNKDKAKQKEAIRRFLAANVRDDWEFQWTAAPVPSNTLLVAQGSGGSRSSSQDAVKPTAEADTATGVQDKPHDDDGYQVDDDAEPEMENPGPSEQDDEDDDMDTSSIYSVVSEDAAHFRVRMEWTSDLSDNEAPCRFVRPGAADAAAQTPRLEKRTRRRRAVREEMSWNKGLELFEARRNAWTCARIARIRSKSASPTPVAPRSPRRFFFGRSLSGSPPTSTTAGMGPVGEGSSSPTSDTSSIAKRDKAHKKQASGGSNHALDYLLPVETLLPVAKPILPPNNPLRASITPSVYLNIFDKVILNNLQPSCPINLSDMLRACVMGWKRDGEWPPLSGLDPAAMTMRRKKLKRPSTGPNEPGSNTARRMSFGILGREKDDDSRAGKGIRKSLQRALGWGSLSGSPQT